MVGARTLLLAMSLVSSGCPSVDPFACSDDPQCVLGGEQGQCRDDRCAYEDDLCPSGLRWPDGTDRGLAGACVPGAETEAGSSSSPSSSEPTSLSTSSTDDSDTSTADADASSTSGLPTCELSPSPPVSFEGESNLVVERLSIDARAQAGVRITDCPGVIVRDLDIRFAGHAGIVITGSPDATIERIALVNSAAPDSGPAAASEIGIHVEDSAGVNIRDVLVDDGRAGIEVLRSDNAVIEDFVVNNARAETTGNDSGGDCLLLQESTTAIVRRFGCLNEPEGVNAHSGIFVDRSPGALVEEGVANNVISSTGAGVRVHTQDGTGGVLVQYVDVVGGTHGCFDITYGDDVTFFDTGCRNNTDYGWVATEEIGEIRVQQGRYYNLGLAPQCCGEPFVEFDAAPDQFVARLPPDVAAPCSVF